MTAWSFELRSQDCTPKKNYDVLQITLTHSSAGSQWHDVLIKSCFGDIGPSWNNERGQFTMELIFSIQEYLLHVQICTHFVKI